MRRYRIRFRMQFSTGSQGLIVLTEGVSAGERHSGSQEISRYPSDALLCESAVNRRSGRRHIEAESARQSAQQSARQKPDFRLCR